MTSLLIILLGTVLIQGSAIAVGKLAQAGAARGVFADEFRTASFTLMTLTLASLLGYTLNQTLNATQLGYLRTPALLLGLALIFVVSRIALEKIPGAVRWPDFIEHLSNQCAMLGMALYSAFYIETTGEALGYGFCAAVVLAMLSASFNALRQRVDAADVPHVFRGIPIALITAGFMALGLLGFAGMVRN
jgi:electron transport complex protein RnfA